MVSGSMGSVVTMVEVGSGPVADGVRLYLMGQAGPIADLGGPELEQLGLQQIWLVDEWQGRPVDEDAGRRHGVEDVTCHSTRSRGRRRRVEAIASHRCGAEDIVN
jgi:hypothetical protein